MVGSASVLWWPVRPGIRTTGFRDTPGAPYPQANSRLTVLKPYRTVAADESNTNELVPLLTLDRSAVDTGADFEHAIRQRSVARTQNTRLGHDDRRAVGPSASPRRRTSIALADASLWSGRMSVCRRATRLNSPNFLKHSLWLGHRRG